MDGDQGTKQLIVPSRSGATSAAAKVVVEDLTKQGVMIATRDVSDAASPKTTLDEYSPKMSPIRGCINASMVLQDSIFKNMTSAQWQTTIRSKVQTSRNLHEIPPKDLDFFVLLSSAVGVIGNSSQSNYAAGCTFQDSLAQLRVRNGQNAVSVDLGPMGTAEYLAENAEVKANFPKYTGLSMIQDDEFAGLLDIVCNSDQSAMANSRGQRLNTSIRDSPCTCMAWIRLLMLSYATGSERISPRRYLSLSSRVARLSWQSRS